MNTNNNQRDMVPAFLEFTVQNIGINENDLTNTALRTVPDIFLQIHVYDVKRKYTGGEAELALRVRKGSYLCWCLKYESDLTK